MAVQASYLEYVLEQLAALPALRSNRMFGAIGLYSNGAFFGLIDDDTLFFKTGETNIASYRERNMPRFMPFPDRPSATLGYHEVPADVIEDAETLVTWARRSIEVALARQAAKSRPTTASRKATKPRTKPAKRSAAKKKKKRVSPRKKRRR